MDSTAVINISFPVSTPFPGSTELSTEATQKVLEVFKEELKDAESRNA